MGVSPKTALARSEQNGDQGTLCNFCFARALENVLLEEPSAAEEDLRLILEWLNEIKRTQNNRGISDK